MEKVVHDDNTDNDKEKDSKLNEHIHSPGKSFPLRSSGGISQRQIDVSFSFLFSDVEFCFCLELSWITWKVHHLFSFALSSMFLVVGISTSLFCYANGDDICLLLR
jgi:hypothetical protein